MAQGYYFSPPMSAEKLTAYHSRAGGQPGRIVDRVDMKT
jgi:hypothetical protein